MAHRAQATVEIGRPPAAVFPWLVEEDRLRRWLEGFVESRVQGEVPLSEGSRSVRVLDEDGRRHEVEMEVTGLDPPHRLEAVLRHRGFVTRSAYRLEEAAGGGTRLTGTMATEYRMLLARLFARRVTGHAQRRLERDLGRLKSEVEAEGAGAGGGGGEGEGLSDRVDR